MREWKEVKLSEIAKVISGYAFKSGDFQQGSGIPAIKIKNIKNGNIDLSDCDFVEDRFLKINEKYHINRGDILVSLTGSHLTQPNSVVGRIAIYKYSFPSLLNQRAGKILPKKGLVDPLFLYAYLSQEGVRESIALRARGAANQANISPGDVEDTDILLPSLPTQRRIAAILSAYDDLIENNLKRIKLLEELAQRTYEEWFVKFRVNGVQLEVMKETGLPEGWERKNLFEISEIHYGFPFKANQFNSDGNGTPIIRIRNIPNSDTNDFTTEKVAEKYWVNKGDLLIGMDGEFYINNWSGPRAYLVQRSCNIKAKDKFLHGYLSQAIVAPVKFFEATISGATVAHLGKKHLETIEIVIPSKEYFGFIEKFNNWLNLKVSLATQNRLLKQSRDLLLPRMMSGEIAV